MHSPDEGVETIAELIARLVYEHEARQAARAKKVNSRNAVELDFKNFRRN